jgi:DNA segregation ATPase FtsK/SpoIIIE and related proteins
MKQNERDRLSRETEHKHWILRFILGCKTIMEDWKKVVALAVYIFAAVVLWHMGKGFITLPESELISPAFYAILPMIVPVCCVGGLFLVIIIFGTPFGSGAVHSGFRRIGLMNHAGETPTLLTTHKDKKNPHITIKEFEANGIPKSVWEAKRDLIESALNIHVVKVGEGKDKQRILLYTVPAKTSLPSMVYWEGKYLSDESFVLVLGESLLGAVTVDLSKVPHILLGGSTGSGKSMLLKLLIMQCVKKDAVVCIADFKGGVDFSQIWHEKCGIIIDENDLLNALTGLVSELEKRKDLFRNSGVPNLGEYNMKVNTDLKRMIFACDEVAEVLDKTGLSKTEKELVLQIEHKLSVIARQGRAFGIHLILATQRPDVTILSGQIRNNIDFRVCGRADNVLSQIILDNASAADQIPKDAQGRFITGEGTVFQGYLFDESNALRLERGG